MRRGLILLAVLALPAPLLGQTLTEGEREALLKSLKQTDERITAIAGSLTQEQWSFKTAEDRWSIAEVCEHILVSEQGLKQIIMGPLMDTPRPQGAAVENKSETIMTFMRDRSQRFQAPDQVQPTGRWPGQAEFLTAWKAERSGTIEWVKTTDADLHGHVFEHPALGAIDGQEWLTFLAGHAERHLLQIEEVMADPGFPPASSH